MGVPDLRQVPAARILKSESEDSFMYPGGTPLGLAPRASSQGKILKVTCKQYRSQKLMKQFVAAQRTCPREPQQPARIRNTSGYPHSQLAAMDLRLRTIRLKDHTHSICIICIYIS